jgi:hypothetical protein
MGSPKESLEQKNIFTEKYDEIRRLDGTKSICPSHCDILVPNPPILSYIAICHSGTTSICSSLIAVCHSATF